MAYNLFKQPRIYIPLLGLLAAAILVFARKGESFRKTSDEEKAEPQWLYATGFESSDPFYKYQLSGRIGRLKHNGNDSTVEFQIFDPANPFATTVVRVRALPAGESKGHKASKKYVLDKMLTYKGKPVADDFGGTRGISNAILQPCPAQDGYGRGFLFGTTRIWRGDDNVHDGALGDVVKVELKNLDGWLFTEFDFKRLTEDLDTAPDSFIKILKDLASRRRCLSLLISITTVNQILQGSYIDEKTWKDFLKYIEEDEILLEIKDGDPRTKLITDQTEFSAGRLADLQKLYFPIKIWTQNVTERRFRQLTLTLNGVTLAGITPVDPVDQAQIMHGQRPSNWDDLYQWATFKLARKEALPGATDDEKAVALKNAGAWQELIGKPAFRLPCKVTLRLPNDGLELPTLIGTGKKGDGREFYLIGLSKWKFAIATVVFFAVLAILAVLAMTTNILRDTAGRVRPDGIEPVSLGKTQMAFWFVLIASAFTFLWITKGEIDTINDTCLILLGIGSGTALGAAFIAEGAGARKFIVTASLNRSREEIGTDITNAIMVRLQKLSAMVGDQDPVLRAQLVGALRKLLIEERARRCETPASADPRQRWEKFLDKLESDWKLTEAPAETEMNDDANDAVIALAGEVKRRATQSAQEKEDLAIVAGELESLGLQRAKFKVMANTAWKRVFADWLCEGSSDQYSFHRFQMMAWTLLLGFVFVAKVLGDRAMPEFNAMALSLLGISAGTYLGFKLPAAVKEERATSE